MKKLPGFRSGSRWKMAIATIGYLLIVLTVIGLFIDTETDESVDAASAVQPTATVAPMETPQPTATTGPTATPETDYVTEAAGINRSVVNALNELATLGDDTDGPVDDWRLDIDAPVGMLQLAYVQAQQLDAPDECADFHANWIAALALLDEAAGLITEGLDVGNDALIYDAGGLIDEAAVMMRDGPQLP